MTEKQLIAFLTLQTNKAMIHKATADLINAAETEDELRYQLFMQDRWWDIYGADEKSNPYWDPKFMDVYDDYKELQKLEFAIWSHALVVNGKEDWIGSLII